MKSNTRELEEAIGYEFKNKDYLNTALTHSSFSNEMKINRCENYERQEFLGDAVLELVSSDFLYKEHTDMPEGELTKLRASLVCEPALAHCARQFGLDEYIRESDHDFDTVFDRADQRMYERKSELKSRKSKG